MGNSGPSTSQKKQELVYQIIDHVSANPDSVSKKEEKSNDKQVDDTQKDKSLKDPNEDKKINKPLISKKILLTFFTCLW